MSRPRFHVGQRVKLTRWAKVNNLRLMRGVKTGTVTAYQNRYGLRLSVTVRPDGYKQPQRFHRDYWVAAPDPEEPANG